MALDTLAYARALQTAGVPEPQAAAQAEALADAFREQERTLATKADFSELRADFSELRADVQTQLAQLDSRLSSIDSKFEARFSSMESTVETRFSKLESSIETRLAQSETQQAQFETRLTRLLLTSAALGGLAGGLVAAIAKLF